MLLLLLLISILMKSKSILFLVILLLACNRGAFAQCATTSAPSYSSGCTSEYFTSITASGAGVVSTVSYSGSSCTGSYFNYFATQGITAPTGSMVTMNLTRCSGYLAYIAVYVDWNNDGIYQASELVGTEYTIPTFSTSDLYSFTIPLTGIVTNTNLHMRVYLGEPTSGGSVSPPCSARWGESCDYYLDATCTTPTLSVSPAAPTICSGSSTTLTVSGGGSSPVYTWSSAPGLSATTGDVTTASPAATTTYSVTGYGPGVCFAATTAVVSVSPPVMPVITASGPVTFCAGGNVTLSETSGSGVAWQWYNGSMAIPGATGSSYVASPGTVAATYSVTVTNAAGCTAGASQTVTVLSTPVAVITPVGPTTVCSPLTVPLITGTAPGYTYQWFDASGAIAGATAVSYAANTSGDYKVVITAATGCTDTAAPVAVTIHPAPVASAAASGPVTFCSYDSVTLNAVTAPGLSYQWLNGTMVIPGATNISYVVHTAGTYDYRLKVTNVFGCTDTTADGLLDVVVNPAPISAITASGPLTICVDSSVVLHTVAVAGDTYQWYYGATVAAATPAAGGTAPSYTATATGYYYVKVTTPAGCTTNSSATAAMANVVAVPGLFYNTPLTFCWGSNVELLLGSGASVPGVTYQWMNDGSGIPGANAATFYAYSSGSYSCFINIGGGCMTTTAPVPVVVNPLPDPVVTYSGGYLQTAPYYTSYQWYWDLAPITGATTYELHPPADGDYSVIVRDTNNCISEATAYVLNSLSVGTAVGQVSPVIYPNPATTVLYVTYPQKVTAVISSMDGKLLLSSIDAKEIDIAALPAGVYTIALYDEKGARVLADKLVKE